jgi:hypothetical protein
VSKFYVSEAWRDAGSELSTHKYYGPVYKIQSPSLPGVAGYRCVSGASFWTVRNKMKA